MVKEIDSAENSQGPVPVEIPTGVARQGKIKNMLARGRKSIDDNEDTVALCKGLAVISVAGAVGPGLIVADAIRHPEYWRHVTETVVQHNTPEEAQIRSFAEAVGKGEPASMTLKLKGVEGDTKITVPGR